MPPSPPCARPPQRLLNSKVKSLDFEKHVVSQLKARQGPPFTANVEGMLNDHELIKDQAPLFTKHLAGLAGAHAGGGGGGAGALPREGNWCVQNLTASNWPMFPSMNALVLQGSMAAVVARYEDFYREQHDGKKVVHWKHTLGTAEVDAYFSPSKEPRKKYTLVVTTLQASALGRISDWDYPGSSEGGGSELTVERLAAAMGLDLEVTKRVVHSLSRPKCKVLNKSGGEKKVDARDVLMPNAKFKNAKNRFTVPMASLDNLAGLTKQAVRQDRSLAIQAAIVRIMKARKTLDHTTLISEVLAQLSTFHPEPKVVKLQIEGLIEREYLERVDAEEGARSNTYKYLA